MVEKNEILSDEDMLVLLFFLMAQDIKNKNAIWDSFENELIYKNRYNSDSRILDELRHRSEQATKIIFNETPLYRARGFKLNSYEKLFKYYLKENGLSTKEIDSAIKEMSEIDQKELLATGLFNKGNYSYFSINESSDLLRTAYSKWMKYIRFKGYNAADSTAPKAELIPSGRANPDHIRYLYLCEDEHTPVYEIRPIIGEQVSVAKFKLMKDVKVYDFTLDIKDKIDESNSCVESLYNTIGAMFSKPNNGNFLQYIPTQYIAEEIKRMGFDGIRFNSSLHKGGVNVVLFNPEICKAVSSDNYEVGEILIPIEKAAVYKIYDDKSDK